MDAAALWSTSARIASVSRRARPIDRLKIRSDGTPRTFHPEPEEDAKLTTRSTRRRWTTPIGIAIAALAAALLPITPAHAAYGPDQPVFLSISGGNGTGLLARVDGTMAFDDGNRQFKYSVRLCWARSYPAPNFWMVVNGSTTYYPNYSGSSSAPGCQQVTLYADAPTHGDIIRNIRFRLNGGWFDSQNGYHRVEREFTYDNPFN
jgi:hypothetical protein